MPLDPQVESLLKGIRKARHIPPLETLTPVAARRQNEQGVAVLSGRGPALYQVREVQARGPYGSVPVRLYMPHDGGEKRLPMLIFFHGGGHVLGSLDTHDVPCRHLARAAGCIVAAVGYRRAPEFPFPQPPRECLAITRWLFAHAGELGADADRIAVGGDSAGGNLAAGICLGMRDVPGMDIAFQLLFYPATDLGCSLPSHATFADGFNTTATQLEWLIGLYLSGQYTEPRDPLCSPLWADDLSGLPPTLIVTTGHDPLHDEGVAYHDKLIAHGVDSVHVDYPGMIHGFINMGGFVEASVKAVVESGHVLRKRF